MKLFELFINETAEEDRAIISLADAVYKYLQRYADDDDTDDEPDYYGDEDDDLYDVPKDDKVTTVGRIGDLFNTPLLAAEHVTLELQSSYGISERLRKESTDDVAKGPRGEVLGLWYGENSTLVLNRDYLVSNTIKSTIAHELRHAVDDFKSNKQANKAGGRYSIPKNKSYRNVTNDPHLGNLSYLAQPAEINARFVQVLHAMVPVIGRAAKLEPQQADQLINQTLKKAMASYRIADLFPEKEKSKDYKRLMKRAVDFIEKEKSHTKKP